MQLEGDARGLPRVMLDGDGARRQGQKGGGANLIPPKVQLAHIVHLAVTAATVSVPGA